MESSDPSSFLNLPLSPPPRGQTSNFTHPESRASAIYIAAGVCLPLALIFAGLRFYAKFSIMKKMRWDDVTCILGLLAGISFIGMTVGAVAGGAYGFHQWDITIALFTKEQLLLSLIIESVYAPCMWFIKLALFVLYLEVFGRLRWLRYLVFAGIIINGLFSIASMVAFIVMCGPKNGQSQFSYISALASPMCTRSRSLVIILGVVNVISDLYLILIPLPAVWSLQLSFRKKIGLSAMFFTGSIACISSLLGLAYRIDIYKTTDNTWVVIPVWVTAIVEMTAGIIVCCMPTTVAVFKQLQASISSSLPTYGRFLRLHSSKSSLSGATIGIHNSNEEGKKGGNISQSDNIDLRPPMHNVEKYGKNNNDDNNEKDDDNGKQKKKGQPRTGANTRNTNIRMTTEIKVTQSTRI